MPSPFPGMNPYLEQTDAWEDFHCRFIVALADRLNALVGVNYYVKIEVRLYLHELAAEERRFFSRAEAGVTIPTAAPRETVTTLNVVSAPVQLVLPSVDVERYSWLEVRDRRARGVVTVIELLSPTNKTPGADRDEYLRKRNLLLEVPTHLVEIDLRRGGERPRPPELPACDYYVLVSRVEDRPRVGLWPIGLREPLPVVPIPLAAPDPAMLLDLQELLHRVYDAAGYGKYIYSDAPSPPLGPADAAWAASLVPKKTPNEVREN